jgi:hypothetical protein
MTKLGVSRAEEEAKICRRKEDQEKEKKRKEKKRRREISKGTIRIQNGEDARASRTVKVVPS